MSDTVNGPWEQQENSDYDEQKPGSGDSHEDEFDDEYGEQRPHGDPDRPDTSGWDSQYGGQIDYWEEVARLNEMARPFDPAASAAADATAYDPMARPFDPAASAAADATAYDPDDFDRAESVDPVGPPTPDSAVPLADAFGDSSVSPSSPLISSDRFDPDESYQAAIVDPGPPIPDSAAGEQGAAGGPSFDPAVPFADAFGDSSVAPSSPLISSDRFDPDESYQAAIVDEPEATGSPSFAPEVEFRPDIPEETEGNYFIG
jgi:hypothetical protein